MAITQNKYIADINYYLTNANVKLNELDEEIDNKINEGTIINLTGLLTKGTGLQGILSGSNFTLNDYRNLEIRTNSLDFNITSTSTVFDLNVFVVLLLNRTVFGLISNGNWRVVNTGDYLQNLQINIVRNTYVGSFTIEAFGIGAFVNLRPSYLHVADNENVGTLHIIESYSNIIHNINSNIRFRIKKTSSDFGIDNFSGLGFPRYTLQTFEYVGVF